MRILVAEDEEVILQTYELALKSRGHQVLAMPDGEECLKAFEEHLSKTKANAPFDLVILDYRMPGKNGLQVAEEILTKAPGQRIIIASAYTHELKIPPSLVTLEFVQKPFGIDMLFTLVEKTPSGISKHGLHSSAGNHPTPPKKEESMYPSPIDRESENVGLNFGPNFSFQI